MKNSLLLILLLFSVSFLFSQTETKLLKEGAALFEQENYKEALKIFEKESKKNESYVVKFWIASCHFQMKHIVIAKQQFLGIINSSYNGPERAMSLVNLGSCYRSLKQIDSAFYYYDEVIELFPNYSAAYFNKGQLLYSLDKFKEAKATYSAAIAIDSTDWFCYMKRQEISFILLEYDDALEDMLKAKELKPDLAIEFNMAYCFSMLERYSEADSMYQKIYDEKDPLFLNNYGFNKHKLGQSELGIEFIRKSLKLMPKNSYAYRNLAVIAIDQGNISKICEYLKEAKRLNFYTDYGVEVDKLLMKYCP